MEEYKYSKKIYSLLYLYDDDPVDMDKACYKIKEELYNNMKDETMEAIFAVIAKSVGLKVSRQDTTESIVKRLLTILDNECRRYFTRPNLLSDDLQGFIKEANLKGADKLTNIVNRTGQANFNTLGKFTDLYIKTHKLIHQPDFVIFVKIDPLMRKWFHSFAKKRYVALGKLFWFPGTLDPVHKYDIPSLYSEMEKELGDAEKQLDESLK